MQLGKARLGTGETRVVLIEGEQVRPLKLDGASGIGTLSDLLHAEQPATVAQSHIDPKLPALPLREVKLLAPLDNQEVWAAGVTYKRSREAREAESEGAARFYDLVYKAARPELFCKAPAWRVAGPGERVHIRRDSKWNVPEPELTLIVSPKLKLVGFTIGNDMSSRDIEGENPLYLPQAKCYDNSCAVGPVITLADAMPELSKVTIGIAIERAGKTVFEGNTSVAMMARPLEELIAWLGKEMSFPHGAALLTGTGIVPGDDFTLAVGDVVHIDIAGIGRLTNVVGMRG